MGLFDKIKTLVGTDTDPYEKEEYYPDPLEDEEAPPTRQSVQHGGMDISGNDSSVAIELKVVRPENYASVTEIADHLLNHCTVVLNLEATNKEVAKRLIDFLAGVAYSIDGQLKRVATNTFVITPCNVDVSGEQMRSTSGEDTGNFTTTFGISGEGGAAPTGSDTLY